MNELNAQTDGLLQRRHRSDLLSQIRTGTTAFLEGCFGLLSLPLEVLLRHSIGRRYYSLPGIFVACVIPVLFHGMYTLAFGLLAKVPTISSKGMQLGTSDAFRWFYLLVFVAAVVQKLYTLRLAALAKEPISTYAGKSLPPIQVATTAVVKMFPGKFGYLGEEITKRVAEPALMYGAALLVGSHCDVLLGWWLWVGAIALFLRSQLAFGLMREEALDQYDALMISRVLHQDLQRRAETDGAEQGVFTYTALPPSQEEKEQPDTRPKQVARKSQKRMTAAELLQQRKATP